ncbi:MAG: AbrB/MazE/SpoVT family DNA-binding domain-containing protein [Clostridiales bacterium]|nr:AbrB/MazE/SpoVT family DNA-binding domain-containing protein [Clostridiales bacterium]
MEENMQDRGIVRRIDELGRLVIPKEIRKVLRIKDGDPLEIYASKDQLVLKKYSPICSLTEYAKSVADGIENLTEKTCFVTDGDALVYTSNSKYKEFEGRDLSEQMEKILKERKSVMISRSDGGHIVPIVKGNDMEAENQIIVPIITNGDCFGAITLFDKDKTARFTSGDLNLLRLGASFLSSYLD